VSEKLFLKKRLLSKFNWSSTDLVPIEPGRSYSSKILKFSIGQELDSINRNTNSIDRALIEHQSNQADPSFKN